MIEIGVILIIMSIVCFIFCSDYNVGILPFIIGVFLLCSIKIFHIKPKIYIQDEYISTKIVGLEDTNNETIFESPVLIQKMKVDYPYTFVIDRYYYKIFPIPKKEENVDPLKKHI